MFLLKGEFDAKGGRRGAQGAASLRSSGFIFQDSLNLVLNTNFLTSFLEPKQQNSASVSASREQKDSNRPGVVMQVTPETTGTT